MNLSCVKKKSGFTLIEMMISISLFGIFSVIALKHLELIKGAIFQNLQASRLLELGRLNNDIIRTVRGAKKITDVLPGRLEVEVYNDEFRLSAESADRRWLEETKKIVYVWDGTQPIPRILKKTYRRFNDANPISTTDFFKDESLIPPDIEPYFSEKTKENGQVDGVEVTIHVRSPFFKNIWTPLPTEISVYGTGI